MYIYNVTITLESEIHTDWLAWMKEKHIPDVMQTGIFLENKMCKLFTDEPEITYAIQYTFRKMDDLARYQKEFAPALQKELAEKFKNKFALFRSVLEVIQ
ncbi:MAG TPA: DUF4286 family protein [Bacteroidia bacterium]